jgi:hypothetical protein
MQSIFVFLLFGVGRNGLVASVRMSFSNSTASSTATGSDTGPELAFTLLTSYQTRQSWVFEDRSHQLYGSMANRDLVLESLDL